MYKRGNYVLALDQGTTSSRAILFDKHGNILVTKQGNENSPKILALAAALNRKQVANFISDKYNGSVISVVENRCV